MRTFIVEVWDNGADYEAGKSGYWVKVRAKTAGQAEEKAMRQKQAEVADCRNVWSPSERAFTYIRG